MHIYRVNTPGPSFTVEADNIDQATCKVVSRGFPPPDLGRGDSVVEYTKVKEDKEYRYLHLWRGDLPQDEPHPFTGCVIYREL